MVAAPAAKPELTLTFDVGVDTSRVMIVLYDSQAGYDGEGAPVAQTIVLR